MGLNIKYDPRTYKEYSKRIKDYIREIPKRSHYLSEIPEDVDGGSGLCCKSPKIFIEYTEIELRDDNSIWAILSCPNCKGGNNTIARLIDVEEVYKNLIPIGYRKSLKFE